MKTDKTTLVCEAVGNGIVRVNRQSWEDLADEALQVVAFGKSLVVARGERPAEYLNIDPTGWLRPATARRQKSRPRYGV